MLTAPGGFERTPLAFGIFVGAANLSVPVLPTEAVVLLTCVEIEGMSAFSVVAFSVVVPFCPRSEPLDGTDAGVDEGKGKAESEAGPPELASLRSPVSLAVYSWLRLAPPFAYRIPAWEIFRSMVPYDRLLKTFKGIEYCKNKCENFEGYVY